jgi:hypothetical protein
VERPEAVQQEFSCQNYLLIKIPSKKQFINIGSNLIMILCAVKLAPLFAPALASLGLGGGVLVVVAGTAWVAKHIFNEAK